MEDKFSVLILVWKASRFQKKWSFRRLILTGSLVGVAERELWDDVLSIFTLIFWGIMGFLRRIVSAIGILSLSPSILVPVAYAAPSTALSCSESLDDCSEVVTGLSCRNVTSLRQLPMAKSVEWISVETLQGQTLNGLEVLGQNPQLRSIGMTEAPPATLSEVAKLPALEELDLVFPRDRIVDLAPLGNIATLKSLDILASSSTDYRWATSLKNLEQLDVSTYGQERVDLKIGETASIKPVLAVDGTTLTPKEYLGHHTERRLTDITATGVTARKAGVGNLLVDYRSEEEPIPGMPNLGSVSYHSSWHFGIRDTVTFTPIGLAQNPSFEGHDIAVIGDLLLAPVNNYPFASLQWMRNGEAIPGATGQTYRLARKDTNAVIEVDYSTKPVFESSVYWVAAVKNTVRYGIPISSSVGALPKPKITGSKIVTEKLTATVDASYFPGFKRSFQWYVQGSPVTGATGSTFVPGAKFPDLKVSVQVSFHWSDEFSASLPTSDSVKVGKGNFAVGKPAITGTAQVGSKLTAKAATSRPASQSVSYQWMVNGQKIKGASGKTYSLTKTDLNKRVSVSAKYSMTNYNTKTVTSASTAKVVPAKLKVVKKPAITGKKATGKVLKVSAGTYNTKGVKVSYQWLRSGMIIKKSTKPRYTVIKSDTGKKLTVQITASKPGYTTVVTKLSKK